jgi:hypothetical protein
MNAKLIDWPHRWCNVTRKDADAATLLAAADELRHRYCGGPRGANGERRRPAVRRRRGATAAAHKDAQMMPA